MPTDTRSGTFFGLTKGVALFGGLMFFVSWLGHFPEDDVDSDAVGSISSPAPRSGSALASAFSASDFVKYHAEVEHSPALDNLMLETRACIGEGARTRVRSGERDATSIASWAASACGDALSQFMTSEARREPPEASAFVQALVYDELRFVPGLVKSAK